MNNDPTKTEMKRYLRVLHRRSGIEGLNSEIEVAIYWFASAWHGGQRSHLYSALSTSDYTPGPCMSGPEDDSDLVADLVRDLESHFIDAETLAAARADAEVDEVL